MLSLEYVVIQVIIHFELLQPQLPQDKARVMRLLKGGIETRPVLVY